MAHAVGIALGRANRVEGLEGDCIDVVGTGGDGRNSFNCSTATALTLAGMGYRVVKHHRFIDSLEIFSLLANVADVKSLVIHPATTTHSQLTDEQKAEQEIFPGTVRLSIGTEHIDDLLADISQALDNV